MRKLKHHPSQKILREYFDYVDGYLIWKKKRSKYQKSKIKSYAGYLAQNGYRIIRFDNVEFRGHRLIWIWHYGDIPNEYDIDHKNRIRNDNLIKNLRLVTNTENHWNLSEKIKGYYWYKSHKKWMASIRFGNKRLFLGYHKKEEDAKNAYKKAKEKYHIIIER